MLDNKTRPLPLVEFGADRPVTTIKAGTNDTMYFQLQDRNGTPVDITTGTLTCLVYNAVTGASVTTTGSTTAKVTSALGICSFGGYAWATGKYNLYFSFVSGNTRIYGAYIVNVEAL